MKHEEKINLSEYSHSILNDELNTVVLAWIEKSGSTTEEEISKEILLDDKKVKNIIASAIATKILRRACRYLDSVTVFSKTTACLTSTQNRTAGIATALHPCHRCRPWFKIFAAHKELKRL